MPDFDFITDTAVKEKVENAHKLIVDTLTVDLTNAAKTQVDEAVTGLKEKNTEILGEKKALQESLNVFEGFDPKVLKVSTDFYNKHKDEKFLEDGTIDELIEKKTSTLTADFETKVGELTTNLEKATAHGVTYQGLFEEKVIDDGVRAAAVKAGMLPTAIEDAVLRGRSVFSLDEHKQIEARDAEGKLATTEDKKVLNTTNWVDGLKETSPHYWPSSEGAGAQGSTSGVEGDAAAKLQAAAASGDVNAYRALRDKSKKK